MNFCVIGGGKKTGFPWVINGCRTEYVFGFEKQNRKIMDISNESKFNHYIESMDFTVKD